MLKRVIFTLVETFESYVDITFSALLSVKQYIITLREEDETLRSSIRSLLSVLCFRVLGRSSLSASGFWSSAASVGIPFRKLGLARSITLSEVRLSHSPSHVFDRSDDLASVSTTPSMLNLVHWRSRGDCQRHSGGLGFKGFRAILVYKLNCFFGSLGFFENS